MFCTPGVTRTPTTLLGGSTVGGGKVEGLDGTVVVEGSDDVSVRDADGWPIELGIIVLLLPAMEVGCGMLVASSAQLLVVVVGPAHERSICMYYIILCLVSILK